MSRCADRLHAPEPPDVSGGMVLPGRRAWMLAMAVLLLAPIQPAAQAAPRGDRLDPEARERLRGELRQQAREWRMNQPRGAAGHGAGAPAGATPYGGVHYGGAPYGGTSYGGPSHGGASLYGGGRAAGGYGGGRGAGYPGAHAQPPRMDPTERALLRQQLRQGAGPARRP